MARILIVCECEDEKVFSDAIEKNGRRDVYWAVDSTVANKFKAEALGIDSRLNLVGSDADHDSYDEVLGSKGKSTTTPKKSKKASPKKEKTPKALDKEVEAVVDAESE